MLDTKTRLAEEVAIVCKDYVAKSCGVAMDWVGVPADFELRRAESIFFLVDIQEISDRVPSTEQLPPTQTFFADVEVPKGAEGVRRLSFQ